MPNVLKSIQQMSNQMLELVQDMLDITRIDNDVFLLKEATYPLLPILMEAVDTFTPLAKQKSQKIFIQPTEKECIAYCDKNRIFQVLSNLLGNAVQYTPEHGAIYLSYLEKADEIIVTIRDTGPGISPEDLPHIFDRFWRSRDGGKSLNAGLGLSIVKKIVEAHGSKAWAENAPENGASFSFTIKKGSEQEQKNTDAPVSDPLVSRIR